MDDLIERLRLIAAWHKPGGPTPKEGMPNRTKTCLEAADRIAALEADNARLMGLVKEAYHEGTDSGFEEGASFGPTESCWENSKSRATLAKIKEATDA